jgi:hypothetical protein
MEERLAETNRLRDAVNAFIAAKRSGEAGGPNGIRQHATEPPQATKPAKLRPSPAARPTEIPGFPLNDNPPRQIPDYGNIARVKAMREQRRERRRKNGRVTLDPIGSPELRKLHDLRTWRTAE